VIPYWVLAGGVLGAILGSFLATLLLRWPHGRSVITGRSQCDHCGRPLRASELIPILSFLASRGRCRGCAAPIARFHPMVELSAAALGGLAAWIVPDPRALVLALFWWQLLTLAVRDARHFWLPDRLTLLLALSGVALGGLLWGEPLLDRLIGGGVGFAVLALLGAGYRLVRGRDGLGAGDPKLFAAIGCWLGWAALAPVLLVAALAGLGVAIAGRKQRFEALPLGTFLAVGATIWSGTQLLRLVA